MIIMIMPVHHSQLLRYAWPSPASLPDFSVDFKSPFFLMTKLDVSCSIAMKAVVYVTCAIHSPRSDKQTTADGQTHTDDFERDIVLVQPEALCVRGRSC